MNTFSQAAQGRLLRNTFAAAGDRRALSRARLIGSWTDWGSENHKIVQFSNRLLLEEIAAPAEDRKIQDLAARQIIMWCREKALRGYTEYASTHYTERTLAHVRHFVDNF